MNTIEWDALIPDLKDWNNGKGADPKAWVACLGNFQLAAAYTLIFWPKFVELDGMVFREGMDRFTLDSWLRDCDGNKSRVEATANHLHIQDIHHFGCEDASIQRLVYLGNILKQIYTAKLAAEFPDRKFIVNFYEPPDQDLYEYQITFYQHHQS